LSGSQLPERDRFPQFCEKPIKNCSEDILTCSIHAPFYGLHSDSSSRVASAASLFQDVPFWRVEREA
jgi:hypothetical protein